MCARRKLRAIASGDEQGDTAGVQTPAQREGSRIHSLRILSLQVMNEEILPACERLRREKGQYMEWQAESAKLDSLRRFCIAHRYVQAQR